MRGASSVPAVIGEADLADRIRAALVGQRVGHACGLPRLGEDPAPEPTAPSLPSGDLPPSDGLAMMLLNMDVVEALGRPPSCEELAAEWAGRVRLTADEYGPALHNLRAGLLPPVSGWFNNWFLDGCAAMERALLWACMAPGDPIRAATYACEDATIDHSEEGIHAAMLVAALLAAAFVEREPKHLLDAADAALPPGSRVARAVESVRQARRSKVGWIECRRRVLDQFGHPNYSQAPQNAALMVLAWLYGDGPEDTLAHALGVGGSPPVVGSAVGALIGILLGEEALPESWSRAKADLPPHPDVDIPAEALSFEGLAGRLVALAKSTLEDEDAEVRLGLITDLENFDPIELVRGEVDQAVLNRDPREMILRTGPVDLIVNYQGAPAIAAGASKTLFLGAARRTQGPEAGELALSCATRLSVGPSGAQPACPGAYFLASARGKRLPRKAMLDLHVTLEDGLEASARFPLLGESCWWVCGPFAGSGPEDLRKPKGPERDLSEATWYAGRDDTRVRFRKTSFAESHMDVERYFDGRPGTLYLVSDWNVPGEMKASVAVAASCGMRLWLDGKALLRREHEESPLSMRNVETANTTLQPGNHRIMIKLVRYDNPVELSFYLRDQDGRPLPEIAATEWRALGEMA